MAGCEQIDDIRDQFRAETPYEGYRHALKMAKLDQTALGKDWVLVGEQVLQKPVAVPLPYRESGYFDAAEASAVAFQLELERGEDLSVHVEVASSWPGAVFIDLFRARSDTTHPPLLVAHADSAEFSIEYEPNRTGFYLLRLQPELLRGGRYTITISKTGALAFPVSGTNSGAIQSFFGDARDGGRRDHHGVDIFAARGTPTLAAASGTVTRVQERGLGGKVVWIRDNRRGLSLYYAHLDSQLVRRGQQVQPGDTVGLVGNTGNARSTPPHLHFGIYRRGEGPLNPFPYVHHPEVKVAEVQVDPEALGTWVRTNLNQVPLRTGPHSRAEIKTTLPRYTPMQIKGGAGQWYRVQLPDEQIGFVWSRQIEPIDSPIREVPLPSNQAILESPVSEAVIIEDRAVGNVIAVLGRYRNHLFVDRPKGRPGWIIGSGVGVEGVGN
jgi:murein DD-endopeptidase MepM/ murein hydrolase activator NlpD